MKKRYFLVVTLFILNLIFCCKAFAATIPNIMEEIGEYKVEYPIRDNAFVMILQPVPDNSGDYTMTICNKQAHCRQTSMLSRELRYIGLFIEDMKPALQFKLNQKLTREQWTENQDEFRKMYADYMNMYDKVFGGLEAVTPPGVQFKVTDINKK